MTDIKMDLTWDIDPDGDIEFSVSPAGSDLVLASFSLDEGELADALEEDLEAFDSAEDEDILRPWQRLAQRLAYFSTEISTLVEDAKHKALVRAHQLDGEDDEG